MALKNPSEIWRSDDTAKSVNVIPTLQYRDAKAAIRFLCDTFGFHEHLCVSGDGDKVAHAQLTFGNGMVMLSSLKAEGSVTPASIYVVVDDLDAHYNRAMAAGANISMEPADQEYGGRLYGATDPEGHQWHFGSYDPYEVQSKLEYSEDDDTATIELRVAGRVTAEAFEKIADQMEAFFERHEKARIIEIIESFDGMDLSLLFDDMLFSLRHMSRFSHVAVVTDLRWAERMANAAAIILSARVRVFELDAIDDARRWARTAS